VAQNQRFPVFLPHAPHTPYDLKYHWQDRLRDESRAWLPRLLGWYDGVSMKRTPTVWALVPSLALTMALVACKKAAPSPAPTVGMASSATSPAGASAAVTIRPMPALLPAVLARVNGEAIERWEFDNAVKRVEARAGGPVPPEKRDEVLRSLLDQLVAYHLLAQQSKTLKIEVPDTEVDARLADVKRGFPTEEAFRQSMTAQGITSDQLRAQTRMSLQVQKVIDAEVTTKVAVQDTEVNAFYQQNLERFKQGDTVHASHILIGLPQGATPAQKQEARVKAQAILKQVRGGADFATMAKAQSQDPGSAQNGGDLGFFPKGQMTPAFEEAAFKLKPGAVSNLVETPFGFHIIKVQDKRGPRTAPLEEVGGQIKEFLTQGQRETKLEQLVEVVKGKSKVEILV
jgi:peptidyl-prolyl cis-trans isomerase C